MMQPLSKYFKDGYMYPAAADTIKLLNEMRVHAEGATPDELIGCRRPSESEAVFEYRKTIWQPITKEIFSEVLSALNKIRKSPDWSIAYPKTDIALPAGEGLPDFLEKNFPYNFTSITNWVFGVLTKVYLTDANALVCTYPVDFLVPPNQYRRPFPFIYFSDQVYDFVEGEYMVARCADQILYDDKTYGDRFIVMDRNSIKFYNQSSSAKEFILADQYIHNLGILPVSKVRGNFKKMIGGAFLFESKISGMLPHLNEAAREYSDLQAEVVQNIFSEKWEMTPADCSVCKGTGTLADNATCATCNGTGAQPRGPYTVLQLRPPMAGEAQLPTPPIGYVQKQIDIAKLQDERIDKHLYKAACAIGMGFVAQQPLVNSGVSKSYDQDMFNTFINSAAEDLVAVMDSYVFFTAAYRYRDTVRNFVDLLPVIAVPDRLDMLTLGYLESELNDAKKNAMNPAIIRAMELSYAAKKFSGDADAKKNVSLVIALDPLGGIAEADKMIRLSNGGITKETYIVSSNIELFVTRALEDNPKFDEVDYIDQMAVLTGYAAEQMNNTKLAVYGV